MVDARTVEGGVVRNAGPEGIRGKQGSKRELGRRLAGQRVAVSLAQLLCGKPRIEVADGDLAVEGVLVLQLVSSVYVTERPERVSQQMRSVTADIRHADHHIARQ